LLGRAINPVGGLAKALEVTTDIGSQFCRPSLLRLLSVISGDCWSFVPWTEGQPVSGDFFSPIQDADKAHCGRHVDHWTKIEVI
jgi:hypothetical protein